MKMKWKGWVSLCLAFALVLIVLPASVSADDEYADLKLYMGSDRVKSLVDVSADLVTGDVGAYAENMKDKCPAGYKQDGLRIWRLDAGHTSASKWVSGDGSDWSARMTGYFAQENIMLAPNWVPMYSANPITAEDPTVVIGDGSTQDSLGFDYQWLHEYKVVDEQSYQEGAEQIKVTSSNASYNNDTGKWTMGNGQTDIKLNLSLKAGDVVTVKNISGGTDPQYYISGYLNDSLRVSQLETYDHNNNVFYATATATGEGFVYMMNNANKNSLLQVSVSVSRYEDADGAVGTKTYSGGAGTYCCKVSYMQGGKQVSFLTNAVKIEGKEPPAPGTEEPGTEDPDNPGTETPGTEEPDNPGTEDPDKPGTEEPDKPGTEEPDKPGTEDPGTETPDNPGTETPDNPGTETPGTETPGTETPAPEKTEYAVTKAAGLKNGTYVLKSNGREVEKVEPGQTVTVETSPAKGYKTASVKYWNTDDIVSAIFPVSVPLGSDGNASFLMPEYNVTVQVVFASDSSNVQPANPPKVEITLDGTAHTWNSFTGKVSFDLMFNKAKQFKVKVTDPDGDVDMSTVRYYLANTNLFLANKNYTVEEIEAVLAGKWKDNADTVNLDKDGKYVLYVKASDSTGNVTYANTQGIVIDTTAPVISGVQDGGTYYGEASFTVKDTYLDTVKVDGIKVEPRNGSYTIKPDNASHRIAAVDKAGNQISCKITVCETLLRDGIRKSGVYTLKKGTAYKLGKGKWKIVGDDTVYNGGITFYVPGNGDYDFRKQ